MKLLMDPELNLHFGNIYREIGGDVDIVTGGDPPVPESPFDPTTESPPEGVGPTGPVDFSEFLWMEHEDEYNREVIRELEEEDMINYYFEEYQDSLEPTPRIEIPPPNTPEYEIVAQRFCEFLDLHESHPANPPPFCVPVPSSNDTGRNYANYGNGDGDLPRRNGEDLSSALGRVLSFRSTLNPNAPEFVPRSSVLNGDDPQLPPPTSF